MVRESEIIKKVLDGNSESFKEILDLYQRQILVYCLKMLNFHQQDAEDITSQVFIKAYTNLASYNPTQKFSSWVYRIAHNETINFIKKRNRTWFIQLDDFLPVFTNIKENIFEKDRLDKVLNQLNPSDKEVLILFYIQEMSLEEISDVFKVSKNTVAQRLRRARNRAKKIIKDKKL